MNMWASNLEKDINDYLNKQELVSVKVEATILRKHKDEDVVVNVQVPANFNKRTLEEAVAEEYKVKVGDVEVTYYE